MTNGSITLSSCLDIEVEVRTRGRNPYHDALSSCFFIEILMAEGIIPRPKQAGEASGAQDEEDNETTDVRKRVWRDEEDEEEIVSRLIKKSKARLTVLFFFRGSPRKVLKRRSGINLTMLRRKMMAESRTTLSWSRTHPRCFSFLEK